mmetsp:Transcript_44839/g.144324  ORF Transcript_44839/g.144324 Transcript_44839/m.144324 type:complete len:263 (+) Transcript_44839:2-790(+)
MRIGKCTYTAGRTVRQAAAWRSDSRHFCTYHNSVRETEVCPSHEIGGLVACVVARRRGVRRSKRPCGVGDQRRGSRPEELLADCAEAEGEGKRHAEERAGGVAERHGQQVVDERLGPRRVRPVEDAEGKQEHVCDGVLQPQRDEGRDGQPDGDELAGRVFGLEGHVRGHTDEPVAEDGAYEDDEQRLVRLSEGNLLSGGRLAERAAGSHQRREEDASEQVAGPRGSEVADDLSGGGLPLQPRHRHEGRVARIKLCAGHRDHE